MKKIVCMHARCCLLSWRAFCRPVRKWAYRSCVCVCCVHRSEFYTPLNLDHPDPCCCCCFLQAVAVPILCTASFLMHLACAAVIDCLVWHNTLVFMLHFAALRDRPQGWPVFCVPQNTTPSKHLVPPNLCCCCCCCFMQAYTCAYTCLLNEGTDVFIALCRSEDAALPRTG